MQRPPGRRPTMRLVLCSLLIAVGLVLVGVGVLRGITGKAAENLPPHVESIDPVPGAQRIPEQTKVFVDLASGYTGVLVIDDVELETRSLSDAVSTVPRGQQAAAPTTAIYEEGNATLTFQPTKGAAIEKLDGNRVHSVKVIYWRLTDGRAAARSFVWTFTVA